jgi:hypothetical protein
MTERREYFRAENSLTHFHLGNLKDFFDFFLENLDFFAVEEISVESGVFFQLIAQTPFSSAAVSQLL